MMIEDAHYQHVNTRVKEWSRSGPFEDDYDSDDTDEDRDLRDYQRRMMSAAGSSYFEPFHLYG